MGGTEDEMGIFGGFKDMRLKWRAAGLRGASRRAERKCDYESAYTLAAQALDILDQCSDKDTPDALGILLGATVLLDQLSTRLGKAAPQQRLEEAFGLAKPYAGNPHFDEALKWLRFRLDEVGGAHL